MNNFKNDKSEKNINSKPSSCLISKLIESEEKYKILFDYAPDGYYISDLNGNFIDANKAAERISGYTCDELVGKNYFQAGLLSIKDVPKALKALSKNRNGLPTGPEEYLLIRKDKKPVQVEISTFPIKIDGQNFALGIARDISECKQFEKDLRNTEKEKSVILDSPPMQVIYRDEEYNLIWANPKIMDSRDPYTAGHQLRATQLAM